MVLNIKHGHKVEIYYLKKKERKETIHSVTQE